MKNVFFILVFSILFYACGIEGSCGQFNIDSYEIITGLDVTKVADRANASK